MKRQGIKKGIYIVPNLITTANLFCGFFAIIRVIHDDYITASWVIMLAGVFDFLDGRVARLTKSQSGFGLEYDSLVDCASFGLAPALLIYKWALFDFHRVGWLVSFLFFACGALRLARFNVQSSDVEKKHFQGLPIPGAAGMIVTFVVFHQHVFGPQPPEGYGVLALTTLLALLMVSNVPYRGFKVFDFDRRANFFFLVLLVGLVFVIASEPQITLFVLAVIYISSGLIKAIWGMGKKVKNFSDFMKHFFQVPTDELVIKKGKKRNIFLKVVGDKHPPTTTEDKVDNG